MIAGPVAAKSLGAMTFGPGNVLFVGGNDAESVYALQIDDATKASGAVDVAGIDSKIAQALGTTADQIAIRDMAVHPASHNVYVTVARGKGAEATPVLVRVTAAANNPVSVVQFHETSIDVA